jgi:hypothetical protein
MILLQESKICSQITLLGITSISIATFHPTNFWVKGTIMKQRDGRTRSWIFIIVDGEWTISTKLPSYPCINWDWMGVWWMWKFIHLFMKFPKTFELFLKFVQKKFIWSLKFHGSMEIHNGNYIVNTHAN